MSRDSATDPPAVNPRRYVAPLREAKARETRRRIVAAARDLFVGQGYAATTIDDVAARAGVSRPTVFVSVGGKPELLKLVRDVVIAGDDAAVPVPQRDFFQRVWDEPDARRTLALYARNMRTIHDRAADVEHVLQAAAHADPALQELAASALAQRRHGCGLVAQSVARKARLRPGLDVRTAGDVVFAVASPDSFRMLVGQCRWSRARYEAWLGETLARELLD